MGTVSGLDASKLALWADYSHWNYDIDLTKTQPWLAGIFTKLCDGKQMYPGGSFDLANYKDKTADTNIQKAYDAGIPCIPYHYTHLILDYGWTIQSIIDWQVKVIMHAIKGKVPGKSYHGFALDVEEINGQTDTNALKVLQGIYDALKATPEFANVPIIFYTRNTILNQIPAVRDWLSFKGSDKILWLAQYVYTGRVPMTWENLYAQKINTLNMRVVTPGYANWTFVQWSACFEMPGCTRNYTDLNFYRGTREECYKWLNFTPKGTTPPQEPPDDETPVDLSNYVTLDKHNALQASHDAALARIAELERWRKS